MYKYSRSHLLIPFILILGILTGCENSYVEITPEQMGYDFYPLTIGNYREYKVQYINYSILDTPDTMQYFLKEQVVDTFTNQAGEISFVLNRHKRAHDTLSWDLDSVWYVTKSPTNLVVVENNVPFVKLAFPVSDKKQWDGNAFNVLSEELYTYENTFKPITIDENSYNSLKVVHNDNADTIVATDIRNEIYAENIGLIYKESIILHYCTDVDCLGKQIVEKGSDLRQELMGYGKE
jgi:hypothetical protein